MDQTTLLLLVALVAFVVGIILGKLLSSSSAGNKEREQLAQDLAASREELDEYKSQVTEHFAKTAELVNNMTESYKDVYRHLAESSEQLGANEQYRMRIGTDISKPETLTNETPPVEPTEASETVEAATESPTAESSSEEVEAPRDYAPKTPEDKEGTLSEGYGLKEDEKTNPSKEPAEDRAKS